ncbi:MAG: helix-turn-helix transcriptional regulator [Eubacterium sp.]|nr:helix-turn-helix transcriptional regulator [Eubacterium sp.]
MTTGKKIKILRKNIGFTGKQLSELTGIHHVLIRKYETDKNIPQNPHIEKIANVLQVRPYVISKNDFSLKLETIGDLYGVIIYLYKARFIDFIISPTSNNIDIEINSTITQLFDLKNHETGKTEIVNQNFYTISLIQKLKEMPSYDKFYKLVTDYDKLKNAEGNHIIGTEKLNEETEILELELQQSTELLKNL